MGGKALDGVGACGWGAIGDRIDIKQWFIGAISPNFETKEALVRCGRLKDVDMMFTPMPRLQSPTEQMKSSWEANNPADRYVALNSGERSMASRWFAPLEPGSVRSCSSALAATALGAGALGMPYAFSLMGIGLGILTLTLAGFVASLSLQILMVAARYTGAQSYAAVLELSLGSRIASMALDFVVLVNGIGVITCSLIFEGDFLPVVFASPPGLSGLALGRRAAVVGATAAVWPLTLSSNISALRYVAIAVPMVLLLTIVIVAWDAPGFHAEARASGDQLRWWRFEPRSWLQAMAIMVNAFANHTNAIPSANQLSNPSIKRIVKATVNGNIIVFLLLAALGVGGYVSWESSTQGDFLLSYPPGRPEMWVCRTMLALIVYLVLPVALFPTAKSCSQLALSASGSPTREVNPFTHKASATFVLLGCMSIALTVSNVAVVLGVLGGLLASSLMFWFPALVFRKLLWPTQPKKLRGIVWGMLLCFGSCCWLSVAALFVPDRIFSAL